MGVKTMADFWQTDAIRERVARKTKLAQDKHDKAMAIRRVSLAQCNDCWANVWHSTACNCVCHTRTKGE